MVSSPVSLRLDRGIQFYNIRNMKLLTGPSDQVGGKLSGSFSSLLWFWSRGGTLSSYFPYGL